MGTKLTGEPWASQGHDLGAPLSTLYLIPPPPSEWGLSPHMASRMRPQNWEAALRRWGKQHTCHSSHSLGEEGGARAQLRGDRKSQPPRPLVPSEDGNGEPGTPPLSHPHQLADTE